MPSLKSSFILQCSNSKPLPHPVYLTSLHLRFLCNGSVSGSNCFSLVLLSVPAPPGLSPDWVTPSSCVSSAPTCAPWFWPSLAFLFQTVSGASDVLWTFWLKLSGRSLLTCNIYLTSTSLVSPLGLYLGLGLISYAMNLVSGWAAQSCHGRGPAVFSDRTTVVGRKPGRMMALPGLGRPSLM